MGDKIMKIKDGLLVELTSSEKEKIEAKHAKRQVESAKRSAMAEILRLEVEITPRRTREAILGTDNGWLANQESLIDIERAKL